MTIWILRKSKERYKDTFTIMQENIRCDIPSTS